MGAHWSNDAQITANGLTVVQGGGLNILDQCMDSSFSCSPRFLCNLCANFLVAGRAAKRGWIPGGDAAAKTYYENAITADIATYALYPGTSAVLASDVTAYINNPAVLYNATDALKLINTQYWIVNLRNGTEAFSNFRRSGFLL